MTAIPRFLLVAWPELAQHPNLLALLARAPGDVDAATAARQLLGDIAVPMNPQEAFATLLENGEFHAAEMLLAMPEVRMMVISVQSGEADDLEVARRRAHEQVQTRVATLQARAHRAGLSEPAPEWEQAVHDRRAWGEEVLDRWEKEIDRAETRRSAELRHRLDALTTEVSPTRDVLAWRRGVEQCIDAREYEAARFLLDGGPESTRPIEPMAVPRLREFPWREPLAEVLRWARGVRPAPPDFQSGWRHEANDGPATILVETLAKIVDASTFTVDRARDFAMQLDLLLGGEGTGTYEVAERGAGLMTRLYSLGDCEFPRLRVGGDLGVSLWLGLTPGTVFSDEMSQSDPVLRFDAWTRTKPHDDLAFDSWTVLALLADRKHRRVNFLREIGGRSRLDLAIPQDIDTLNLPIMDRPAVRVCAQWILDILRVEPEEPVFVDVLLHYCGGRQRLVLHLLRLLLRSIPGRQEPVSIDELTNVWESQEFRTIAYRELLGPLDTEPLLRAVLGAAVFIGSAPGGTVSIDDALEALQDLWGAVISTSDVITCFNRLGDLGILETIEGGVRYRVPQSGIGTIVLDALSDVDGYVEDALRSHNAGAASSIVPS